MKNILFILLTLCSCFAYCEEKQPTLQELQNKIELLEKENEYYNKEFVLLKEQNSNGQSQVKTYFESTDNHILLYTSLIALYVTLITGIVAIAIPVFMNNKTKEQIATLKEFINDKAKNIDTITDSKLDNIKEQLKEVTEFKKTVEDLVAKTEKLEILSKESSEKAIKAAVEASEDADKAAKYSELNKIFSEACIETNPDEKIKLYTKIIELDPKYASTYYNRGHSYDEKEMYDEAIKDYNKAIELDPKNVYAYNNRGNTYNKLALKETNPTKKAEYKALAKADKAEYDRLSKK